MTRWLLQVPAVRGAAVALGFGLVLVAATAWRATHFQLPAATESDPTPASAAPALAPTPGYGLDRLLTALGKDPFHPERRRPGRRFQLPADQQAFAARVDDQTAGASLRLIGTAVNGDGGGFAMCAWQGGAPRIVRIGEQVSGWTLVKVTQGAAEFTTPNGRVTVRVPKAGT